MEFIAHRVNKIKDLDMISREHGVEIDLRDFNDKIILQHDPFVNGDNFENFLKNYNHGTLILNIKSEQIEFKILDILNKFDIKNYFFLDSSFPMIVKLIDNGEKNIAIRFSDLEGLDTIQNMENKIKWIWIDSFKSFPIDNHNYELIKKNEFKNMYCFS